MFLSLTVLNMVMLHLAMTPIPQLIYVMAPLQDGPSRWSIMLGQHVESIVVSEGLWRVRWSWNGVGVGVLAGHQRKWVRMAVRFYARFSVDVRSYCNHLRLWEKFSQLIIHSFPEKIFSFYHRATKIRTYT